MGNLTTTQERQTKISEIPDDSFLLLLHTTTVQFLLNLLHSQVRGLDRMYWCIL